jgi:hypothetical protein
MLAMMGSPLSRSLAGAVAGVAATVPMSGVMLGARRLGMLPVLPPEDITDRATARAGAHVDEETSDAMSVVSHLGYGAATGAAYRLAVPQRLQGMPTGVAYGLAIYAGSYLGWLPALRLRPHDQGRRNAPTAVMVLAHAVFGAVLGLASARATRRTVTDA